MQIEVQIVQNLMEITKNYQVRWIEVNPRVCSLKLDDYVFHVDGDDLYCIFNEDHIQRTIHIGNYNELTSTIETCSVLEKLSREKYLKNILIELDETYFDIAQERINNC